MKAITYNENTDTPVTLKSYADGTYSMVYGFDGVERVDYATAATSLGECLMHSASCASLIDND